MKMTSKQKTEVKKLLRKLHGVFWDEIFDMFPEADTSSLPNENNMSLSNVVSWYESTTPSDATQYIEWLIVLLERYPHLYKDMTHTFTPTEGGKFKFEITQQTIGSSDTLRNFAQAIEKKRNEINKVLQKEEFPSDRRFPIPDRDSVDVLFYKLDRIKTSTNASDHTYGVIELYFSYTVKGFGDRSYLAKRASRRLRRR